MAIAPKYARVNQGEAATGQFRQKMFDVTTTGTYVAGGFAIQPSDIGWKTILGVSFIAQVAAVAAHGVSDIIYTAGKLLLVDVTTGLEMGSIDISTGVYRVLFYGY